MIEIHLGCSGAAVALASEEDTDSESLVFLITLRSITRANTSTVR
jgi:hypothetical protein